MRYLFTFLLAMASLCPAIGQVASAEYFIDSDPGYGKATPLSITGVDTAAKDFLLPLSALAVGYHVVSIRAKDAQGHWSLTNSHTFYLIAGIPTNIISTEYFIDTDPGHGKATTIPVAVSSDSSLKYVVSLSAYGTGFHTIGIRSKDNIGEWSTTQQKVFYVDENNAPVNITSLQYYFTSDSLTTGVNTYQVPVPAPTVDLNFTADLSSLVGNKIYNMHIWAMNGKGVMSEVLIKKVKVCNGDPAKANYDFVVSGTQVNFIDKGKGSEKYLWDFGDLKKDTISNPLHAYDSAGVYNVKLIVSNFCNTDTLIKVVNIVGLTNIFTNHGGNTGTVSVDVRGGGFAPGMQLFLHKTGQQDIVGDTVIVQNSGLLSTTFDLLNKPLGLWDVIAIFPNKKTDTLHNGFKIEKGTDPKLWVNISGSSLLRIGFNQVYTITYGNNGNIDAELVPLLITGLPLGTQIEILNPLLKIDTLSIFRNLNFSSNMLNHTIDDSSTSDAFRMIYINQISSGSVASINVIFHLPLATPLRSFVNIKVILGKPEVNTPLLSHVNSSNINYSAVASCTTSTLDLVASGILDFLDYNSFKSCFLGIVNGAEQVLDIFHETQKDPTYGKRYFDITDFYLGLVETGISCGKAAGGALFPETKIAKLVYESMKIASEVMKTGGTILKITNVLYNCGSIYEPETSCTFTAVSANATDPNAKFGTGDSSNSHFTNQNPLSYTINFENTPTSNLNAQTVTVTDTLNVAYYDKASFGFTSVIIGDSVYALSSPTISFIHDIDFTAKYGVKARVVANFDTLTGIAQWKFFSIDPVTNQTTTNALAGFLPPDVVSPKGQGYVSFIVDLNANIKTGDSARNKATIKFDYNPDITTNCWQNVFDFVLPASKVSSLPAETPDTTFKVKWSGTDDASGIRSYDIYYAVNNGVYQLWKSDVSDTEDSFTGKPDTTYHFYSIAKDNAGNIETPKIVAEATIHISASAGLPVTALPLVGTFNRNMTVTLSWATLTEINNKGFNIERNAGNGWSNIGFVKGNRNSDSRINYSFIDQNIETGKTYLYRYNQLDYDGKFAYSNTVSVKVGNALNILSLGAAPNPFTGKTNITYNLPLNGNVTLELVDYTGREMTQIINKYQQAGTYKVELNGTSNGLSSGTYFIKLITDVGSIVSKIIFIR